MLDDVPDPVLGHGLSEQDRVPEILGTHDEDRVALTCGDDRTTLHYEVTRVAASSCFQEVVRRLLLIGADLST